MRRSDLAAAILAATLISMPVAHANAQTFVADFSGFHEVPLSILSRGEATLELNLDQKLQSLTFTLSYTGLSTPVTQAHIHLGEKHLAGGIIVFFCSNLGNGPSGTQLCPGNGGTVSGIITPANIIGVAGQGFPTGDFGALTTALLSESTYANIHTQLFPGGELRGQIVDKLKKNQ
jgi:hypothetical protein